MRKNSRFGSPFVYLQITGVVLAFSLLVFLGSWSMDTIENRHITNGMESALNDTENNITTDLKELETLLHYISETIHAMIMRGYSFDKVQEYITDVTGYIMTSDERLKECTTGIYGVFDVFDGRFHDGTGWEPPQGYVPEERPWYMTAVQANGKIGITEPYMAMAFDDTHTLTFARRIFDEDSIPLGVVCLDVLVDRVRGFTANTYFADSGYGFLLNKQLEVLAHPDKAMWGRHLREIDSSQTLARDLEQGIPVIERRMKNHKNEPSVVSFRQLENGWHIGMVISENAYFKEMKRMRLLFIVLGIVLAALFIVVILRLSTARRELQYFKDEFSLTSREQEVLTMLLTNLSVKQIAEKLELSQSGVNFHTRNIYRKFGIQSRTELLAKFVGNTEKSPKT